MPSRNQVYSCHGYVRKLEIHQLPLSPILSDISITTGIIEVQHVSRAGKILRISILTVKIARTQASLILKSRLLGGNKMDLRIT